MSEVIRNRKAIKESVGIQNSKNSFGSPEHSSDGIVKLCPSLISFCEYKPRPGMARADQGHADFSSHSAASLDFWLQLNQGHKTALCAFKKHLCGEKREAVQIFRNLL
ncbi:hypothetical protein PoB_003640300 [Plakobranchus ocellatus]|uniref:Uncharacterized protein n=1 Tax=Plakobranchus ocellatus TaxID=259542 RepID=A0AAV4ATL2_9GAST|nr:hypothetical protein PoB_003640300 [Plakobranchus ocellatus]